MPKKLHHIPSKKVTTLLAKHQSKLRSLLRDSKQSEYHKRLSKAHYLCEVESFLQSFGINKEIGYALKLMSYFESRKFYEILYRLMGGAGEDIALEVLLRLEILRDIDSSLYETFLRLVFVHHSSEQTASSGIQIDHQAIATHLAKQLHIELKESFGTDRNGAFFRIYGEDDMLVATEGKSIKTLRKKAYKKLVGVLSRGRDYINTKSN